MNNIIKAMFRKLFPRTQYQLVEVLPQKTGIVICYTIYRGGTVRTAKVRGSGTVWHHYPTGEQASTRLAAIFDDWYRKWLWEQEDKEDE